MVAALRDPQDTLRSRAAQTLGEMEERTPLEPLLAALGDSNEHVRVAALEALQRVYPRSLSVILSEAVGVLLEQRTNRIFGSLSRGFFADSIDGRESVSPTILDTLTELLDWHYWEVRMKAAKALGRVRRNIPNKAIRRLYELRHDSESRGVREAADDALAEILSLEAGIEDD